MISLCATKKQDLWNIDNGCSKHMISDPTNFIKLKDNKSIVTFGDNKSSKIIGKGTTVINSKIKAENVLLVENLKLNMISVSKTCDQRNIYIFYSEKCEIREKDSGRLVATTTRMSNNIYILDQVERKRFETTQKIYKDSNKEEKNKKTKKKGEILLSTIKAA